MERRAFFKVLLGGVALPFVDRPLPVSPSLSSLEVLPWRKKSALEAICPLLSYLEIHADPDWLPHPMNQTFKLPPLEVPSEGSITVIRDLSIVVDRPFTVYGMSLQDDQGSWHVRLPASDIYIADRYRGPIHLLSGDTLSIQHLDVRVS